MGLFLVGGCRALPDAAAVPPGGRGAGARGDEIEAGFRNGKALLESGDHTAAIKQFAYLRDHARNPDERDRAVVALSMALQDSGNRGAALGVLEPLPEYPRTGLEAMKCVLAGELHLHQQNFGRARVWLSRGLEVEANSRKPYRAAALFNLGKALVAENQLEDALVAFGEARDAFSANGDETKAEQCKLILADIRRALQ